MNRRPVTALRDALWPLSAKTVWLWYLLAGSFVTYLYVVVPSFQRGSTLHGPLINALGLSGRSRSSAGCGCTARAPSSPGACSSSGSCCSSPETSTRTASPACSASTSASRRPATAST